MKRFFFKYFCPESCPVAAVEGEVGQITHLTRGNPTYYKMAMSATRGGTKMAGNGGVTRPSSLREALKGVPIAQRDFYLLMREAFLALEGTGEVYQRAGKRWLPVLMVGQSEVARVNFRLRGAGEMTVSFPILPDAWLREMAAGSELRPVTRTRLRSILGGELAMLPAGSEADLADVVAVLLLVHARLWHGSQR